MNCNARIATTLIFLILITGIANATPPQFIMTVDGGITTDEPPDPLHQELYSYIVGSDDGSFTHSQSVSGTGLIFNRGSSTVSENVGIWVKGPNQPGGIPYRFYKNYSGDVSATKNIFRNQAQASFPQVGYTWQSAGAEVAGPDSWLYMTPLLTPGTKTIPIDKYYERTGTTTIGTSFPEYPGTSYYLVYTEGISAGQSRRYSGSDFVPTPSDPTASVNAFISYQVAIDPLPLRKRRPGNERGPKEDLSCEDGAYAGSINLATGNYQGTIEDPIRTRGYPLRNRIHLNSQVVETSRPMGNATFTYDIHVTTQTLPLSGGGTGLHWILVDGDGQRLDFGPASSAPTPEPGVFSFLSQTVEGFELIGAGPPEELRKAGNYRYHFDTEGKLLSFSDPAGNEQELTHTDGKLTSVTDTNSNKSITYEYTGSRITRVIENGSDVETGISYTGNNVSRVDVKKGTEIAFAVSFTYDGSNRLATFERDDEPGTTYTFAYSSVPSIEPGEIVYLANVSSSSGGSHITYNLDSSETSRTTVQNYKGGTTAYDFDSSWNLKKITLPPVTGATQAVQYQMSYDTQRNRTFVTDGATSFTLGYNTMGLVTSVTDSNSYEREFGYTGTDLNSISDSIGALYNVGYSNPLFPHVPTSLTNGENHTWSYTQNSFGQLGSIAQPTGSQEGNTIFEYEETVSSPEYGYLRSITDGGGNVVRYDSYNLLGDITSISTDPDPSTPLTRITDLFEYDAAHRLRKLTHADSKEKRWNYTGRNLSSIEDEAMTSTSFTWCPTCGAIESVSRPLSFSLNWERDSDHLVKNFDDARAKRTSYSYGFAEELKQTTYPDNSSESYKYDNSFRLREIKNARLQLETLAYDNAGRVQTSSFPTTGEPSHSFTYNGDGTLHTVSDAVGTKTYEYFPDRQLKTLIMNYSASGLSATQRVEYLYFPDNKLKKITWKNGSSTVGTWEYTYNIAGQMQTVKSFGQTNTYVRDGEGKILTQNNANGTSINYVWNDARKWPTSITHKKGATTFNSFGLVYDQGLDTVGNLTQVTEYSGTVVNYSYDALYRLLSDTRGAITNYGYDLAGNLLSINGVNFASYDDANKISSLENGSIAHDSDGNILNVLGAGIPSSSFSWNTLNKLTQASFGATTLNYTYDAFGQRAKQVDGTKTRFFIFSGDRLLGEIENGTPKVAYTWGDDGLISERLFIGIFALAVEQESGDLQELPQGYENIDPTQLEPMAPILITAIPIPTDITLWYHFGPQGETRHLTNPSGNVVDTYTYDAYGIPLTATNNNYNPHRYGGKYGYHSNLNAGNLVLAGQRWYSPNLRRWISRDPIKYEGGDNLYRYVNNNPVGYVDISGQEPTSTVVLGGGYALGGAGLAELASGVAAGITGPGLLAGGAIVGGAACFIWSDDCLAAFQGCFASEAKPSLEEQAEALRKLCGVTYANSLKQCNQQNRNPIEHRECTNRALEEFNRCKRRAEGLKPITSY